MGDHTNWSEEEFKAYLCLYAAESNFEIHADEKSLIDSKFSPETIEKIKEETDDLNDYQRSQIIAGYIKEKDYNQEKLDEMLSEIKEVYFADGKFDQYEQHLNRCYLKLGNLFLTFLVLLMFCIQRINFFWN